MKTICQVCIHHCALEPGQTGLCGARKNEGGEILCENYGQMPFLSESRDFHGGQRNL